MGAGSQHSAQWQRTRSGIGGHRTNSHATAGRRIEAPVRRSLQGHLPL